MSGSSNQRFSPWLPYVFICTSMLEFDRSQNLNRVPISGERSGLAAHTILGSFRLTESTFLTTWILCVLDDISECRGFDNDCLTGSQLEDL
jgi:hypothetical protein